MKEIVVIFALIAGIQGQFLSALSLGRSLIGSGIGSLTSIASTSISLLSTLESLAERQSARTSTIPPTPPPIDYEKLIERSIINKIGPRISYNNFNNELPQNYIQNIRNPLPGPNVRPIFRYPSIKNSLNNADSNFKAIKSQSAGGLSNYKPNGMYFYG